jgi:uncharacterized iron-regulated membrane protein
LIVSTTMTNLDKLNRKAHYWLSLLIALPVLVVIGSGVLLQLKKNWTWVQPPERSGSTTVPAVSLAQILDAVQRTAPLEAHDWSDVRRLDLRPGKGIVKVVVKNGWEAQIDIGTGEVVQARYRRSDLIEAIHDGSFFAGDFTKLGLFLPAGVGLLLLWCTGLWMFARPLLSVRRRRSRGPALESAAAKLAPSRPARRGCR